jgi:two-component system phosphate regulon sensor histidine kinase PhoR
LNVDPITIEADRNRLYQVFYNLILNAYLYSNENAQLKITVSQQNNHVQIQISDTGYGISVESLPFIFERFYRVDSSRTRESGGSGIGLTIVKQFVEAHKGSISVESQLDIGTTFTINLPLKQSS